MVVGQGGEFHQNLPNDSDPGLFNVKPRQMVKVPDDPLDVFVEFHHGGRALGQGGYAPLFPGAVEMVGGSGIPLVGSGGVEDPHENVAVDHGLHALDQHRRCDLESRVGLHAVGVNGDHGNLGHARFLQCPPDKADVVGSPASAACLAHEHSGALQVVFARQKGLHHLADDDEGWVAGIVVHILESHVNGGSVVILQNLDLVAKGADGWL